MPKLAAILTCFFLLALACANAQTKTVLDGVYSSAQAKSGKAAYETNCARCHSADLAGFSGPPLKGDLFMDRWREFKLNVLVDLIQTEMPLGAGGSLSEKMYLDISAYLLQSNGIPAGQKELTSAALPVTLLVGPNGPKPLPSSAQVSVVGCLIEDSGNGFFVAAADEPVRTLDAFQLTAEELKNAKDRTYGSQVFRLENLGDLPGFTTQGVLGFKAIAKGILVRQPQGARINVMSLKSLSESCDPNRDAERK
jgi:mono/diheme cytochrome c family protein